MALVESMNKREPWFVRDDDCFFFFMCVFGVCVWCHQKLLEIWLRLKASRLWSFLGICFFRRSVELNPWRSVKATNDHMTFLVGGLEHFLFFHILGRIIPTDELIFFRGVETTNQIHISWLFFYLTDFMISKKPPCEKHPDTFCKECLACLPSLRTLILSLSLSKSNVATTDGPFT